MIGRRVATVEDLERPGDYCRNGDSLWFILPIADPDKPLQWYSDVPGFDEADEAGKRAIWAANRKNGRHRIGSGPNGWTFTEHPDGSCSAQPSIACGRASPEGEYFHGYLDEGHVWREC